MQGTITSKEGLVNPKGGFGNLTRQLCNSSQCVIHYSTAIALSSGNSAASQCEKPERR